MESPTESHLLCSSKLVEEAQAEDPRSQVPRGKRHSVDSLSFNAQGSAPTFGLVIALDEKTGACTLSFCKDASYPDIHPNAYAPASLSHMRKLGGGGSGVAVFEGHHPQLGDVVMKHGGEKDLKELFALATIAQELTERGKGQKKQAAEHLRDRIPAFSFIYISPNHLGEKRRELWHRLSQFYKYSSRNLLLLSKEDEMMPESLTESSQENTSALDPVQEDDLLNELDKLDDVSAPPETSDSSSFRRCHKSPGSTGQRNSFPHASTSVSDSALKSRTSNGHTRRHPKVPFKKRLNVTSSGTVSGHRNIAIYAHGTSLRHSPHSENNCTVNLLGDSLNICIPSEKANNFDNSHGTKPIVIPGNGYANLKDLVKDLYELMKDCKWKLTLGQRRIGGENPKTGNLWLYAGKLHGSLLNNLVTQKIQLLRDLASLTTTAERDPGVIRRIQEDVARLEEDENCTVADIQPETDAFVANCIKKNFQSEVGRFSVLNRLGRQFRELNMQDSHHGLKKITSEGSVNDMLPRPLEHEDESMLILTSEEVIPGHHLGSLTRMGALMGDTFESVPFEPTAMEMHPYLWRNILRNAIQPRRRDSMHKTSPMAMARIWTCGLTDGGVHNLFLNEETFWLFDLGSPQLYSAPGFLTKFLFSFFHTLGMEEAPDNSDTWVRRFEHNPISGKLRLTIATTNLLNHAYSAFEVTLDRLIAELFDNDDSLRWQLIEYVTLQLISDASFCLQRWTIKGGGRKREANHQKGLEKWLWRALWDLYVAFDLNRSDVWTKLGVVHPSNRESVCLEDMKDLCLDEKSVESLQRVYDGEEAAAS